MASRGDATLLLSGSVRFAVERAPACIRNQADAQVVRHLGVNDGTLTSWVAWDRQARGGADGPLTESERAELQRLRRDNAELAMMRDVLKRSVALWVKEAMGR